MTTRTLHHSARRPAGLSVHRSKMAAQERSMGPEGSDREASEGDAHGLRNSTERALLDAVNKDERTMGYELLIAVVILRP